MNILGLLIVFGILLFAFKVLIVNASLPKSKIEDYLVSKKLKYIRHLKIKKTWNPYFENGESLLYFFRHRKHNYLVDAEDQEGNPYQVEATWYQSISFRKNKVFFKIKP